MLTQEILKNTFPASLADERGEKRQGRENIQKKIRRNSKRRKNPEEMGHEGGNLLLHTIFNSQDSNFSPIVKTVIKRSGYVGDLFCFLLLFLKPLCQ